MTIQQVFGSIGEIASGSPPNPSPIRIFAAPRRFFRTTAPVTRVFKPLSRRPELGGRLYAYLIENEPLAIFLPAELAAEVSRSGIDKSRAGLWETIIALRHLEDEIHVTALPSQILNGFYPQFSFYLLEWLSIARVFGFSAEYGVVERIRVEIVSRHLGSRAIALGRKYDTRELERELQELKKFDSRFHRLEEILFLMRQSKREDTMWRIKQWKGPNPTVCFRELV